MLNKIIVMGRITKDPELRRTQSGTPVTSITLAVDRDYQQGGEKQTDFIDVVAWRSTAEFIDKYLSKGRAVVVEGSLQSRKWTDKEGNKRISWEVQALTAGARTAPTPWTRARRRRDRRCTRSTLMATCRFEEE